MKTLKIIWLIIPCLFLFYSCKFGIENHRKLISLNGTWSIAESIDKKIPIESEFSHTISIPGLLDLATPSFDSTGFSSKQREYFWYQKEIEFPTRFYEKVFLKIHKAKFGHKVYINGNHAGEYPYNFTPGVFDISSLVEFGEPNTIQIRIGASPEALPDTIPYGEDVEKALYYPGIYDDVELMFTNYPYIENVQIVPDLKNESVKAVILVQNGPEKNHFPIKYNISKSKTNEEVQSGTGSRVKLKPYEKRQIKMEMQLPSAIPWSPENPFLYEMNLSTPNDSWSDTFGMREFKFDSVSKRAILNGKPYYLRGTNIALHRFFEDSVRQELPWNEDWIRAFHDTLKAMNWNSYRFHVGFAPEIWYKIADEKGFLVQDEYPIWGLFSDDTTRHMATTLLPEFKNWIRERRNHPSVVVWDAQNETVWQETGKVIDSVRHMDLSNRPWDNGFSAPRKSDDMIESHPYLFSKVDEMPEGGLLRAKLEGNPEPFNDPNTRWLEEGDEKFENPIIINEYGWIWLYRDGTPAKVAETIWNLYPKMDTPEKRWDWRGRVIAAKTEYWRSQRNIAGVQHFCVLTVDRPSLSPRSQVSDEWASVKDLIMHEGFKKHVKSAFSPVGIMIKKWDRTFKPSERITIPVVLFNDLHTNWEGKVDLILFKDQQQKFIMAKTIKLASLEKKEVKFYINLPKETGKYELRAEINVNGKVKSSRLFSIK